MNFFGGKACIALPGWRKKLESARSLLPPKNYLVLSLPAKIEAVVLSLLTEGDFGCRLVEGASQHWSIYTSIYSGNFHPQGDIGYFFSNLQDLILITSHWCSIAIGKLIIVLSLWRKNKWFGVLCICIKCSKIHVYLLLYFPLLFILCFFFIAVSRSTNLTATMCIFLITRQHSSRMHTTSLPTILFLVATTRCQYWWGGVGPQMNKFEQVCSHDHQMSVVGVGPRSDVQAKGVVPYHVMFPTYPPPPMWTDTCLWKHYLPQTSFLGGNNASTRMHSSRMSTTRFIGHWGSAQWGCLPGGGVYLGDVHPLPVNSMTDRLL